METTYREITSTWNKARKGHIININTRTMKLIKLLVLIVSLTILSGCGSIGFRFNSMNTVTAQQPVKTYTTTHQTFANLNPWDLGLSFGGNWIHCRTHGFHDLNDWTDFNYSPYWCRPSHGFLSGSQWNSNWGGMNNWNPRFNYLGNMPNRWSPFGYGRWGYNNWMGNVYYGNRPYNWYRGVNYHPGQNNWYRGRNVYRGRRATNRSGRWESTTPVRRVNAPSRTRTRTNVTPNSTRPTRTTIPTRTNVRPTRTNIPTRTNVRPTRTNTRPTRTNTRTNTRPTRTNVRPTRTSTRTNTRPTRTNTRKQR